MQTRCSVLGLRIERGRLNDWEPKLFPSPGEVYLDIIFALQKEQKRSQAFDPPPAEVSFVRSSPAGPLIASSREAP